MAGRRAGVCLRGPAWPGMISYARTGASIIRVLPVRQPDGDYDVKYLELRRSPNGVVIHYYLPRAPQEALSLTLLDADGTELRRFTAGDDRVPAAAGLNRFLWNRRLPGAPKVLAADLEPVGRPDGLSSCPAVTPSDSRSERMPRPMLWISCPTHAWERAGRSWNGSSSCSGRLSSA